ncbi:hypothetical protein HAX54_001667, partial [Datura stramonium]|nr:hypothetical protein [Datura stramonium]
PPNDFFAMLNVLIQNLELEYFNVLNSKKFPMNFNEPVQEAFPLNDVFAGLNGCNQDLEFNHFNVLNSNEFLMNFNDPIEEAYISQPPAVPSFIPPNDFFAGLNGYNQDLELDPFNVLNLNEFVVNFNELVQE